MVLLCNYLFRCCFRHLPPGKSIPLQMRNNISQVTRSSSSSSGCLRQSARPPTCPSPLLCLWTARKATRGASDTCAAVGTDAATTTPPRFASTPRRIRRSVTWLSAETTATLCPRLLLLYGPSFSFCDIRMSGWRHCRQPRRRRNGGSGRADVSVFRRRSRDAEVTASWFRREDMILSERNW